MDKNLEHEQLRAIASYVGSEKFKTVLLECLIELAGDDFTESEVLQIAEELRHFGITPEQVLSALYD